MQIFIVVEVRIFIVVEVRIFIAEVRIFCRGAYLYCRGADLYCLGAGSAIGSSTRILIHGTPTVIVGHGAISPAVRLQDKDPLFNHAQDVERLPQLCGP